MLDEINKIKQHFQNKINYATEQFNCKVQELQEYLKDSIQREKNSREKAIELLKTHEYVN